jgi:hypothetical protein
MPCFTKPGVLNAEQIIDDMGRLLACVDFIKTVGVLGGEPLLNPDLPRIVAWLLAHPKVGYVEVVTNGTLVPGEALLNALHNRCASLVVSDYRAYSRAVPAIKKVCGAKGVKAVILQINSWRGYGGTDARGRSIDRLEAVFAGCRSYHCRSLLNGLFHLCPRSSSGHAIGIFNASGDCVNIRALDSASAREALRSLLYRQPFIKACDYCDNSSACRTDDVPVAEQV